jgi:hypothetical protein
MVTQETEGVSTLPAEEPKENQAADDASASGPSGEGPQDAAAAQDAAQAEEAQTIAQEKRAAAALRETEPQKRSDMEKRRSALSRTACDKLIRDIQQKLRPAEEEQIDADAQSMLSA